VDITRLMSAEARQVLLDAARRAAELGSADVDTDHLLWAALQREPMRELLRRAGADPDALAAQVERAP
jgi:ATP-dependent Clp protease ATP-binding subunit ClpC